MGKRRAYGKISQPTAEWARRDRPSTEGAQPPRCEVDPDARTRREARYFAYMPDSDPWYCHYSRSFVCCLCDTLVELLPLEFLARVQLPVTPPALLTETLLFLRDIQGFPREGFQYPYWYWVSSLGMQLNIQNMAKYLNQSLLPAQPSDEGIMRNTRTSRTSRATKGASRYTQFVL